MKKRMAILAGTLLLAVSFFSVVSAIDPLDGNDPYLDPDHDGVSNVQEFEWGSDPNNPDSDNDGLPDGWEILYGRGTGGLSGLDPMDPTDANADADWITGNHIPSEQNAQGLVTGLPYTNYDEYYRHNISNAWTPTNPLNGDTDGDGWLDPDDDEPLRAKADNDGVTGGGSGDSDGNGVPDGSEPGNPNADSDGDGLSNGQEAGMGTDPGNADSDGDGLTDGEEMQGGTDPNNPDTDGDGLSDGEEGQTGEEGEGDDGTDPMDTDSDNDGLPDGWESHNGLDPLDPSDAGEDPDGDGLTNLEEYEAGTDPNNADSDGDTLTDSEELDMGTNPNDPDTDHDGIIDPYDPNPLEFDPRLKTDVVLNLINGVSRFADGGEANDIVLRKGETILLEVELGFEDDPATVAFPEVYQDNPNGWGPVNITVYFNQTSYGPDNIPRTADDEISEGVATTTVGWNAVNSVVRYNGNMRYFRQNIQVTVPDRVFAGAVAIVLHADVGYPGMFIYENSWAVVV